MTLSTPPKTLIFDLDGTLIHSAPDIQTAANVALHALCRPPLDLATIISFIGNGVEVTVKRSLQATGGSDATQEAAALRAFHASYDANLTTLTRPYPGVIACLTRLKEEGARLGICTNKPTEPAIAICDALGLSDYFDVIIGAEAGHPKKPDPASLLRAITTLKGTPETSLYVGDSEVDYQTALNADVPFRLFSAGYLHEPLPDLALNQQFSDWTTCGF